MTGSGYKKIMWGVLISGLHLNISVGIGILQLIPPTVGFFIIYLGLAQLAAAEEFSFMDKAKRDGLRLVIISAAFWIYGFLFGYEGTVAKGLTVCVGLIELLLYAEILNKSVRYYKERENTEAADRLRRRRMSFIKAFMALLVLEMINMIPFSQINEQLKLLTEFLTYTFNMLGFMAKLWLSLIIQKLANETA